MLETVNGTERETKRAHVYGTYGTKVITKRDAALVMAGDLTRGDVIADGIVERVEPALTTEGVFVYLAGLDLVHASADLWIEVACNVAELFG